MCSNVFSVYGNTIHSNYSKDTQKINILADTMFVYELRKWNFLCHGRDKISIFGRKLYLSRIHTNEEIINKCLWICTVQVYEENSFIMQENFGK